MSEAGKTPQGKNGHVDKYSQCYHLLELEWVNLKYSNNLVGNFQMVKQVQRHHKIDLEGKGNIHQLMLAVFYCYKFPQGNVVEQ